MNDSHLDVIVVGGGQAGLALGHELTRRDVPFLIVDAAAEPGASWRDRWDSLRLFTPTALNSLPGLPFPGHPEAFPTKDQVADYLVAYRTHFDLPVRWNTPVRYLGAAGRQRGSYVLHTPDGALTTSQVVLATGAYQLPWRPPAARGLGGTVHQIHASEYRNPDCLPDGPVVVAGSGNSGLQLADELSRSRPATLACGHRRRYLPQRIAGRSVFRWSDRLGFMNVTPHSALGRLPRRRGDPVVGDTPGRLARRRGVTLTGRIVSAGGGRLYADDGSVHRPRSVVWATGYALDFSWVGLPVVAPDGWIYQRCGRTTLPGLYTLGLPWQCTNASELIGWVGRDAAHIADAISRQRGAAFGCRPAAAGWCIR